jgi:hypothetical protein
MSTPSHLERFPIVLDHVIEHVIEKESPWLPLGWRQK